jgi:hypothetical protein
VLVKDESGFSGIGQGFRRQNQDEFLLYYSKKMSNLWNSVLMQWRELQNLI